MTNLYDYHNVVDQLLTRVDEIRDRIGKIDSAINDRSAVDKAHADTEIVATNHWDACSEVISTSGGEGAQRLVDNSTRPPSDPPLEMVSDQDLMNQRAAVEIAATQYRAAELDHQHYRTRWSRRIHRALLVAGAALGCLLAYIAVKILIGIVTAIVAAFSSIAIIAIIAIAVYLWLR